MIRLFYGSDTQKTYHVVQNVLLPILERQRVYVKDKVITELTDDHWTGHEVFILGILTWYYGELQSDWEAYFEYFKTLDSSEKTVVLFGLGDQREYDEWFIDGVGILAEALLDDGANLIGAWPMEGYDFQKSRALKNDSKFYGLALDEDNQYELTKERCERWMQLVLSELNATGHPVSQKTTMVYTTWEN